MSGTRLAPTRSQLLRSRDRLARVARGIDLLTRKRKALAAELFGIAVPAIAARARITECSATAYAALLAALADRGAAELESLGWPSRPIEVDIDASDIWGVATAAVRRQAPIRRSLSGRGQHPGSTGPAAALASAEFERLLELLLDAASTELRLRRLSQKIWAEFAITLVPSATKSPVNRPIQIPVTSGLRWIFTVAEPSGSSAVRIT